MSTKDCLSCSSKACRTKGSDCYSVKPQSIDIFIQEEVASIVRSSSKLIDNGLAGSLSRMQEVVEFIKSRSYQNVGLAYCFGLEKKALAVADILRSEGITVIPARCSMGGIREREIDSRKETEAVSCNPAGQALFLNERADFVIEFGLCMGHDLIFHETLKKPFTVLLVKDRVHNHAPLEGIEHYQMRTAAGVVRAETTGTDSAKGV